MIVLHPAWVAKAGIGDIVRDLEARGLEVSNALGSRFFHAEPPPVRSPPSAPCERRARPFNLWWPRT